MRRSTYRHHLGYAVGRQRLDSDRVVPGAESTALATVQSASTKGMRRAATTVRLMHRLLHAPIIQLCACLSRGERQSETTTATAAKAIEAREMKSDAQVIRLVKRSVRSACSRCSDASARLVVVNRTSSVIARDC